MTPERPPKDYDFRVVTASFVVRKEQAEAIRNELGQLPYGFYHMGTTERELTQGEWQEVKLMADWEGDET